MPTITNLRWTYRPLLAAALVLLGFAQNYSSMACEFSSDLPDASRTYGVASSVLAMAAMLGGIVAYAIGMIVRHIELLEIEVAKLVKSDADPKSALQSLANSLRETEPSNMQILPKVMKTLGQLCRRLLGR